MRAVLLGPCMGSKSQLRKLLRSISLHREDLKIGVDGGTALWLSQGIQPTFAVGDWDSLGGSKGILTRIPHVTLSKNKDRSDLFYSICAAIEAGATEILCLGLTGGRADHQLANLLDLSCFSAGKYGKLDSVQMRAAEADYIFLSEKISHWEGSLKKGAIVSLFTLGAAARGVSLTGFRYFLRNANLLPSSQGLSNQVKERFCRVDLRKGQLVVIIPRNGV